MSNRTTAAGAATSPSSGGQAANDAERFERLTLPHLSAVARFARSLTRDRARGDDLVQETYLRALRGWHTFRDGADPKRWLLTICHHTFLHTLRREKQYVFADEDDPELDSLASATAHWQAQQSGVVQVLERMDLGPAIERALGELPAHYRGVVVLVDIEAQSYEEAALVLGVAIGTVRSRLFRARRLLQEQLLAYARDAGFESVRPAVRAPTGPSLARTTEE
jgi:RNA polymerase sigma-70 factor (ECF subfamily)